MKYLLDGEATARLDFRLLTSADFEDWLPLFSEPTAALFLGIDTQLTPTEQCEFWFAKALMRYEKGTGGMNVLLDRNLGRMVGQCGLVIQEIEGKEVMEVGYSVLPEFWGKGYASEAAIKCKEFAFEEGYTDFLISMVHIDNVGSATVAQRNGMRLHRHFPDYHGSAMNMFRITKEEWLGA